MRLYRFEFSTNVERVTLALAHKGLEVRTPARLTATMRLLTATIAQ
jgi:hypothetical protein